MFGKIPVMSNIVCGLDNGHGKLDIIQNRRIMFYTLLRRGSGLPLDVKK